MIKKILIIGSILILLLAASVYYYVFVYSVQNHRDLNKELAISISATDLSKAFITNEQAAKFPEHKAPHERRSN